MSNVILKYPFLYTVCCLILNCLGHGLLGQTGTIRGTITTVEGLPVEFATVQIKDTGQGTTADADGAFELSELALTTHQLIISYVGYEDQITTVDLSNEQPHVDTEVTLSTRNLRIAEIVVTGSKTFKRKTESPVIVGVIHAETLGQVQACNLSEGLKFQPGLRIETDCQTCNYTQLRMNGLAGGYSQILINGRPIFSPLTGLYGLEQLPTNMIDRIEVVRGGGSSLYGSSAIGGTVNVLTKIPKKNSYAVDYNLQSINGQTRDHIINANTTLVTKDKTTGLSLFGNYRKRGMYDHNDDEYSELPEIRNTSFGASFFTQPTKDQKLEFSLSKLHEYRWGGENTPGVPVHLTQQAEERTHDVWMASLDYQINWNEDQSSLITYGAWQHTDREHYTGIYPEEGDRINQHIAMPPYGTSDVSTYNVGLQLNHRLPHFITGPNILTLGAEYVYDTVLDDIPAYNYLIDQTTKNVGTFLQSDWSITPEMTLLSGVRMDDHNLVDGITVSPRASLLYKVGSYTQVRLTYGTGFRAPQAFDTDLHIAFAGGGISRVLLSPELSPEKSRSWSTSINYDKPTEDYIFGFTLEAFDTRLDRAFVLTPIGEDEFGERFEKQNGQSATVRGMTLELRANYNQKLQIESGFTLQSSAFENEVTYIDEMDGLKEFIRTPDQYGYATLSWMPTDRLSAFANYIYTGPMLVPHFAGAPNQTTDEIITTPSFSELSFKLSYALSSSTKGTTAEIYTGVKNLFNSYQSDFDIGKNRDSNFVYGPSQPRTIYLGVKIGKLN